MSDLQRLLEVQALDLATDKLRARLEGLPEREARTDCDRERSVLDEAFVGIEARRADLTAQEHALGTEVADVAAKVKQVETTLYSGSVTAPKELESLTHEIRLLKRKQGELEDRELELLEGIDTVEAEIADHAARVAELGQRARDLDAAIREAEDKIGSELEALSDSREGLVDGLPQPVLDTYARLREQKRLVGRAAARLQGRGCEGCRVDQPVLDVARMQAEPWDAVVCCVHCGRILVR